MIFLPNLAVKTLLGAPPRNQKVDSIPVIYDSDIGDDIDDTWALGLLLCCPELDLKLVVGDQGKAEYRAKLFAKMLQTAGRTDVPVGIGLDVNAKGDGAQAEWVKDYDLKSYPGKIYEDGVQAIIDIAMKSKKPVTLIAVGPLPNIAEALKREPRIAEKLRFVGMHGSVRLGYNGYKTIAPEYNVVRDVKACRAVFAAPWDITITPLDTCGLVDLCGEHYRKVRDCKNPIPAAIIQNYRYWCKQKFKHPGMANRCSSTLFDTVAVYLAISQEFCKMERLGIRVDDKGFTLIDPKARQMNVATEWKDIEGFYDFLVERLTETKAGRAR
ncbi:MAG: nucleoside hydrolase [Pirellulales bacterium]|nr:nucleoside hydrolase [Pirellulales bacterium]